ncbi:4-hydroxyphenylacetate 3-monooxygenase [Aureimonas ureilytica]|uniref:4-hydroxyphenylacetate 3-monooxygenase n=1 Tax=Aureimonas ureilytica TaxID=401562 RepID=A0A175R7P8_9HYPH|nr:4-hydroxyphenylacetate 3-monooxygenase [Aureimonas ureilytica]KTR02887.1 4-hydroxyphenylacetate 3-monooxygenase [Aureimonas ureilytica]
MLRESGSSGKSLVLKSGVASHPPADRVHFREAMSHFAAPVCLVTTDGPAGRRGVTVTSVCSVSDEPPTVLFCLNQTSLANTRFDQNGVFAVNLLASHNEPVARAFAGEGQLELEARFAAGRWTRLVTDAPVLMDALISFDCRVIDSRPVATHRVIVGEVLAIGEPTAGNSLLYRARRYHSL